MPLHYNILDGVYYLVLIKADLILQTLNFMVISYQIGGVGRQSKVYICIGDEIDKWFWSLSRVSRGSSADKPLLLDEGTFVFKPLGNRKKILSNSPMNMLRWLLICISVWSWVIDYHLCYKLSRRMSPQLGWKSFDNFNWLISDWWILKLQLQLISKTPPNPLLCLKDLNS